jgi:hypothetical protein
MAGNGPLVELGTLREYAAAFSPRVVLWFYFENDLIELQKEEQNSLLLRYLDGDFRQGLVSIQEDIDHALGAFIEGEKAALMSQRFRKPERQPRAYLDRLSSFVKLSQLRKKIGFIYGSTPEQEAKLAGFYGLTMDLFRKTLTHAKILTEQSGGKLVFVYLPGWGHYGNEIGVREEARDQVLAIVRSLNLSLIDIHRVFQSHSDPLSLFPFRGFGHYNEEGHRLVAEEVLSEVAKTLSAAPADQVRRQLSN